MESYDITISTDFDSQTGLLEIEATSTLLSVTLSGWDGEILEGIKATLDLYQDELDLLVDLSLPLD